MKTEKNNSEKFGFNPDLNRTNVLEGFLPSQRFAYLTCLHEETENAKHRVEVLKKISQVNKDPGTQFMRGEELIFSLGNTS